MFGAVTCFYLFASPIRPFDFPSQYCVFQRFFFFGRVFFMFAEWISFISSIATGPRKSPPWLGFLSFSWTLADWICRPPLSISLCVFTRNSVLKIDSSSTSFLFVHLWYVGCFLPNRPPLVFSCSRGGTLRIFVAPVVSMLIICFHHSPVLHLLFWSFGLSLTSCVEVDGSASALPLLSGSRHSCSYPRGTFFNLRLFPPPPVLLGWRGAPTKAFSPIL